MVNRQKKEESSMSKNTITRRTALKAMLWAAPATMLASESAIWASKKVTPLFKPRALSAGEKVRTVQIGVFHRGSAVLGAMKKSASSQMRHVAFADIQFTTHQSTHEGFPGVPCYRDYRQMFEEMHDQFDAVVIATPDHSHFPMVMHALLMGKHVYVEKPMAQNVYECRMIEKVAKDVGVVTQMGNQGASEYGTVQFGQWVDAGLIKNVKRIDAWMTNPRRWHGWTYTEYPESTPPQGYDWDQWIGRRQFRPHSDKMTDGNWRCWYEFGCGCMGDWGAHILDAFHRYLDLGQPYEITTKVMGPSDIYYPQGSVITFKFKARGDKPPLEMNWYDGQGNIPKAPEGFTEKMGSVGSMLYMDDAVVLGRSHGSPYQFKLNSKLEKMAEDDKLPLPADDRNFNHYKNFINACQGIEPANSPFEIAAPLSEMLALGCVGQRFGGTLKYDAKAMKITNHPEADAMLRGPKVRDHWDAYDQYKPADSKVSMIEKPGKARWEKLFDKRLSQWENPYSYGEMDYRKGVVSLSSNKGKWFLLTKKEYANFIFEGEIKMPLNSGNSGFLFRCQKRKNKAWGYQAEVDTADRKWSGGLYDEGRRKWFISPNRDVAREPEKQASIDAFRVRAGECFKQGEWNTYRINAIGGHIQIFVNDVLTTDIHDEMDLQGHIGIQHHGEKELTYQFRNLRIKDLGVGGDVFYPHRETFKA
jgi:hypothetical protein